MPRSGPGRPKNPPEKTTTQLIPDVDDLVNTGMGLLKAYTKVVEGTSHSPDAMAKAYELHQNDEFIKAHGNCKLSDVDELTLACTIMAFDLAGVALPQHFITEMAEAVFGQKFDGAWFTRFYSRHEDILAGRRKRGTKPFSNPAKYREEGVRWVGAVLFWISTVLPLTLK